MAELGNFEFTKDWTNPTDFPTYEPSEAQVRADMQELYDEIKDYLNGDLITGIHDMVATDLDDLLPIRGDARGNILMGDVETNKARLQAKNAVAMGKGTEASGYELVFGRYNIKYNPAHVQPDGVGPFLEEVGNGEDDDHRSNARALTWQGTEFLAGDLYVQQDFTASSLDPSKKVQTKGDLDIALSGKQDTIPAANGTGTGSLVVGDTENNEADSDYSVTFGAGTAAGGVTFKGAFASGASTALVLSDYQPSISPTLYKAEEETLAYEDDVLYYNGVYAKVTNAHAGEYGDAIEVDRTLGNLNHARVFRAFAYGEAARASGLDSSAVGEAAHAFGEGVVATGKAQLVFGAYNDPDAIPSDIRAQSEHLEIVGNGVTPSVRSNARTLDWQGNERLAGKLTLGKPPTVAMDAATKKYVDEGLAAKADTASLGTAAAKDVPASGNASSAQVVVGSDTRLTDSRPASDVSSWAKASTKPSYTASEVGAAPTNHASTATTYGTGGGGKYGHVRLSESTSSTSGADGGTAATPSAVKAAYDLANGKPSLTSSTTPVIDGAAAVGSSTYAARANHVHPVDTGRQSYNALRNAYFKNPINSRGRGTGSANKVNSTDADPYIIDGWKVTSGYAYLASGGGVYLNGTIQQVVDEDLSGTWTGSALASDGAITPTTSTANKTFSISASGKTLYAAKWEKRPSQTLYTGSGSSAVLVDGQPDIGLELLRCQARLMVYDFGEYRTYFLAQVVSATEARLVGFLPVSMAGTPTVTMPSASLYNGAASLPIAGVYWINFSGNTFTMSLAISNASAYIGQMFSISLGTGGKIIISSEL